MESDFRPRVFESRAVLSIIRAGNLGECALCGAEIKYSAQDRKRTKVIANVYEGGKWNKVEHYHSDCYAVAGEPYGPVRTNSYDAQQQEGK